MGDENAREVCDHCNGSGDGIGGLVCSFCHGWGFVRVVMRDNTKDPADELIEQLQKKSAHDRLELKGVLTMMELARVSLDEAIKIAKKALENS